MSDGQTTEQTTAPTKIPQPHGGALNSGGTPGNKGGRPLNEFKARMRELADSEAVEAYLRRCLAGEFGPKFFLAARQQAKEDGYGKAVQAVEIGGTDGGPLDVTVRFVDVPKAEP